MRAIEAWRPAPEATHCQELQPWSAEKEFENKPPSAASRAYEVHWKLERPDVPGQYHTSTDTFDQDHNVDHHAPATANRHDEVALAAAAMTELLSNPTWPVDHLKP